MDIFACWKASAF